MQQNLYDAALEALKSIDRTPGSDIPVSKWQKWQIRSFVERSYGEDGLKRHRDGEVLLDFDGNPEYLDDHGLFGKAVSLYAQVREEYRKQKLKSDVVGQHHPEKDGTYPTLDDQVDYQLTEEELENLSEDGAIETQSSSVVTKRMVRGAIEHEFGEAMKIIRYGIENPGHHMVDGLRRRLER